MVTTIQLNENVKISLDRLRETGKETYEEIIVKMMSQIEEQRRRHLDLMIEGAKETAKDSLEITKEFESIDNDLDWEWKNGD